MKGNTRWSLFPVAAASLISAAPVLAQDVGMANYQNPVTIGIFAGATVPLSDFADFAGTGWHAGGLLQWASPTSPFGFRVDGAYHKFGDKNNADLSPSIVNGTINAMWNFPSTSTARPYILGGVGVYNERCSGCASQTKLGLNAGVGVNVPLSGFATLIEARYHVIFDSAEGSSNTQFIPISFGILFR